ncbi:putative F420-0 ABC transporter substrate-binding protein [Homoserinimonas hongtaonis]|uniref:Putative F420-0 ABC transporter substrate-binding protein n=1 Tax=Homoserinimonas hongtaonis TaxID=2079791 RepID=A0A2U1T1E6_9MICO|nr:putative F420-0 ABC transporter substrate-binding protein [Salinibacterium hongtaonis]PWB97701.1 putative F420-0 ABC transporter substrate-binding protein [Salinibacterium hongtaonis]
MLTFAARFRVAAAAASAVLLLAGCSASTGTAGPSASPRPEAERYPVTVDNCGTDVTFEAAPERVITIKSSTTETMLALGLGDRIIGTAALDGPLPDSADSAPTIISDKVPGREAVLALAPDLVYAGWESNFSAEGVGERPALTDLGIATYVSPAACKGEGYMPDPLSFDAVFDEIREVGAIFDADAAAAALVDDQRAQLESLTPAEGSPTAVWYSSGRATPYVGAGIGAPAMIMKAAGLSNMAADVRDTWTSLSWEAVIAANPDVIVLVDSAWNTADSKIATLEENPATAALDAVRQKRYVVVPFAATEAGTRNVDAVASIIDQLQELGW